MVGGIWGKESGMYGGGYDGGMGNVDWNHCFLDWGVENDLCGVS